MGGHVNQVAPLTDAGGELLEMCIVLYPCLVALHGVGLSVCLSVSVSVCVSVSVSLSASVSVSVCVSVCLCVSEASEAYIMTMSCFGRLKTNNPRPLLAVCALGAPASVGLTAASSAITAAASMAAGCHFTTNFAIKITKFPRVRFSRGTVGPKRSSSFSRFCDCCSGVLGRAEHCVHHNISRSRYVVLVQTLVVQPNNVTWASLVQSLMMHFHSKYFPRARA